MNQPRLRQLCGLLMAMVGSVSPRGSSKGVILTGGGEDRGPFMAQPRSKMTLSLPFFPRGCSCISQYLWPGLEQKEELKTSPLP